MVPRKRVRYGGTGIALKSVYKSFSSLGIIHSGVNNNNTDIDSCQMRRRVCFEVGEMSSLIITRVDYSGQNYQYKTHLGENISILKSMRRDNPELYALEMLGYT